MNVLAPADPLSVEDLRAIEAIERDAWIDMYRAAPEAARVALGFEARAIGDGALLVCRMLDNLQFNRLTGLGAARPAHAGDLDEAIAIAKGMVVLLPEGLGLEVRPVVEH